MSRLIQCDHVTKQVGNFVLRDIHFDMEPGYILGVIGNNGAGKSTLMRVLLGSYKLYNYAEDYKTATAEARGMAANRGDVFVNGYSVKRQPGAYKAETAYILNDTPFAMGLTVKENGILYGQYYQDFHQSRYRELCDRYGVPFLEKVKDLSKGEQVKMQLAFALSRHASIYLLDEPAGNLDVEFRDVFYDVMRDIVKDGDKGIIYVSHMVEEMENLADYVLWIEEGEQKEFAELETLLDRYCLYSGPKAFLQPEEGYQIVGVRENKSHIEHLLRSTDGNFPEKVKQRGRRASLKEMMYYEEEARRRTR